MASRLAIFDVETCTTETVLIDPDIIEAPNWYPDNSGLLINKAGQLFRVPFDAPQLHPVDTGFARKCNNDHGISPDGKMLVISDSTETGKSLVYTLPITGGTPNRITDQDQSYWHGWSPDGSELAYTARRNDVFDIHVIPVDGGKERKLTSGFTHCDGPDYTRDGKWIWFNGEIGEDRSLYRIRPDGSDLQQMTRDEFVDWFPHPNPANDTVLYIAYPPGTEGHPRDRKVSLRLLHHGSKTPQVLYEMIGGQGSINTPCWSPNGRKFAFVETVDQHAKPR